MLNGRALAQTAVTLNASAVVKLPSKVSWPEYWLAQYDYKYKEVNMLNLLVIIGAILLILWLLGFLITPFMGGLIHVLLVIGIILLIIWLVQQVRIRKEG